MYLEKQKHSIIICVFACVTIPKYREQVMKIKETWYKRACQKNLLVLFFLGEEPTDITGSEFIYLSSVGNDYESASLKQNLGIKYIVDNYDFDFLHVCGTDAFLVIDNMIKLVELYDPSENIVIGGHGCYRMIDGKKTYFMTGGCGFLLSKKCCSILYTLLDGMYQNWKIKCIEQNQIQLIESCDVALFYYLHKIETMMMKEDDKFFHCTYYGFPCNHPEPIDNTKIVACHNMSLSDFDRFQAILQSRWMA